MFPEVVVQGIHQHDYHVESSLPEVAPLFHVLFYFIHQTIALLS